MNRFHRLLSAPIAAALMASTACLAQADVVAHWSFDRTLGDEGMYPDTGPDAHQALPEDKSSVIPFTGKAPFGGAVTFNGSPGSFLKIPAITTIQKSSFTVAAWVNMNTPGPNFIITDWRSAKESGFVFGTDPLSKDKRAEPIGDLASAETSNSGNNKGNRLSVARLAVPAKPVALNEWHHMAWVWDRDAGTLTAFVDGVSVGQQKRTARGLSKSPDLAVNKRDMRIGSRELISPANSPPANFNGSIDELWIFNAALSVDQLGNLMKTNNLEGTPAIARVEAPPTPGPDPVAPTPTSPPQVTASTVSTPAAVHTPEPQPDVAPTFIPPPNVRPDVTPVTLSTTSPRSTAGKTAGVIACLVWAISLSSYLFWGLKERARLRAAGKL